MAPTARTGADSGGPDPSRWKSWEDQESFRQFTSEVLGESLSEGLSTHQIIIGSPFFSPDEPSYNHDSGIEIFFSGIGTDRFTSFLAKRFMDRAVRLIKDTAQLDVVEVAAIIGADAANSEALGQASRAISKTSAANLSPGTLLVLVLAWLLAVGVPVALPELPAKVQTTLTGELATVPIALAITAYLKRKDSDR